MQALMTALREHVESTRPQNANPHAHDNDEGDPDRVVRLLYKADRKDEKSRGGTKIIHASSTIRMPDCARAYFLMHEMKQAGATFSEAPWGSMRLTWAYGRAAEKHVRQTLLADADMHADAYGLWKCRCGKSHYTGRFLPSAETCKRCNTKPTEYHETLLLDPDYGLSGNPDFMFWDECAYRVVEIKSIRGLDTGSSTSSPNFKQIDTPLPDHVNQGCHYVKMAQRKGLAVHRRPLVLYVSKYFEQRSWYKPFIPGDGAMRRAEEAVAEQRATTKAYREALAANRCPNMCTGCEEDPSKYQKSCKVWAECMSRRAAE